MAMAIAIPSSLAPRLGPGCTLTISGLTSAAAGHKLLVTVDRGSTGEPLTQGAVVLPSSSSDVDVVLGILGPGYTSYSGPLYGVQYGAVDDYAVDVNIYHMDSSFSVLETVFVTGRKWDATGWITSLLHYGIADQSAILADILASVRHTFITP